MQCCQGDSGEIGRSRIPIVRKSTADDGCRMRGPVPPQSQGRRTSSNQAPEHLPAWDLFVVSGPLAFDLPLCPRLVRLARRDIVWITSHLITTAGSARRSRGIPWAEAPRYVDPGSDCVYGACRHAPDLRTIGIRDKPIAPARLARMARRKVIGSIRRECCRHSGC